MIDDEEKKSLTTYLFNKSEIYIAYVLVGTHCESIIKVAYIKDYTNNLLPIKKSISAYQVLEIYGTTKNYKLNFCYRINPWWNPNDMFNTLKEAIINFEIINPGKPYPLLTANTKTAMSNRYLPASQEDKKTIKSYLLDKDEVFITYVIENYATNTILKVAFTKSSTTGAYDAYQVMDIFGKSTKHNINTIYFQIKWFPRDMFTTLENATLRLNLNGHEEYFEKRNNTTTAIALPETTTRIDSIKEKKNKIRSILEEKLLIIKV
jgi:hypothetical protein